MLVPSQTTLRVEDFPDKEKEWIDKLCFPLNQFLLAATNAINGNITLGDNIPCQTTTLSFTYGSTADFPKTYKWTVNVKPVEVRVCSATENGVAVPVVIAWSYSTGVVSIASILKLTSTGSVGLTTGSVYNIVLRGQP